MENNLNGVLSDASQIISGSGQMGGVAMPNQTMNAGISLTDLLVSFSERGKGNKEVSLSTLKRKEIAKIMQAVETGWQLAEHYYQSVVEPEITKRRNIYNADEKMYQKKFPYLSEQTKWRSRDVQTAAEWLLPGLMEAFVGGNKPVDIKGVSVQDDLKAKKIEEIVTYQVERKNSLHRLMKFSIEEALRSNFGIAKLHWKHDERREEYKVLIPNDDIETALAMQEEALNGSIEIKNMKSLPEAPDLIGIIYDKVSVTANYPVIEYLSPYELRFTPEASTLQETKFVAHRKIVMGDYLKRKELEGIYQNVDEAIKKVGKITPTQLETANNNEITKARSELADHDNATTYVELRECYVNVDYNNDGILEKLIVHCIGEVPIRIASNDYGFVPFYPCCIYYEPNKVFSERSYEDLIEQQQDLKTALIKQMIVNIARQNVGQKIVDADVIDMNALIDGDEIVMANNAERPLGQYVYAIETPQLSPNTIDLINYCQGEIESQTGSTKYNKGLDSSTLNDTATGISMIMSAADKRAKMIARDIAENFYVPLIKGIIILDQLYMRDNEIVRLNDQNVQIRKEELNIDYDLIINVGEGAGTKEMRVQYLMILINQLIPMLVQQGIADANTIYNSARELLEEMGLKTAIASLIDPKSPEAQQKADAQMKEQQAQILFMQQQEEKKQQVDLLKSILPRVSIKYEELPLSAQAQILGALGIQVDASELVSKVLLDDYTENQNNQPLVENDEQSEEVQQESNKIKLPKSKKETAHGIKEGNVRAYTRKGNKQ